MMMIMEIVIVIVTATILIARVNTVHANDYITLDITCNDHMIKVTIKAKAIVHELIIVLIRMEE